MHELDVPRIGYVHAWQNTQNEGWVRAALDTYGVPYTYFADKKLREGNLRQKYDVIIYPHVGGSAQSQVNGIPKTGTMPLPYKKTAETPNLGVQDQTDDIRGGMGWEGLMELYKFVREGGTLITEGSTATIFPEYNVTTGVTVENSGRPVRARLDHARRDRRSAQPDRVRLRGAAAGVLQPGAGAQRRRRRRRLWRRRPRRQRAAGRRQEHAADGDGAAQRLSTWDPDSPQRRRRRARPGRGGRGGAAAADTAGGRGGRGGGGGGRGGFGGGGDASTQPRVVLAFPSNADDMLLSGVLVGGQSLANRAQVVDAPVGQGHVVMFAIRPFWRWQTQGTFFLGFNAILNWNDLNAGRPAPARPGTAQ